MRAMHSSHLSRRALLQGLSGAALATACAQAQAPADAPRGLYKIKNGRIRQSVVPWCFNPMPVPELARLAVQLGITSVELCDPKHWPLLKELGLTCAIAGSHGFSKGFAHTEEHEACLALLRSRIEECAAAGVERVITFSGFRRGISDEDGIRNMVDGLKKIAGLAEEKRVTICIEMLNSRVAIEMKGHPDYFCDDIERTVEICKQVGSERVKVLFDIYHVQIMHGDLVTRLKQHLPYIGHIHTAGVPGRGELDAAQEINYRPLMQLLADAKYSAFVGQEFIPVRDKAQSLAEAVELCDV